MGVRLGRSGRWQEAVDALQKAVRLNPDSAETHYALANALQASGQIEQAIESYWRAIDLNPNLVEALNDLGVALWVTQRPGGLDAVRRAVHLKPHYADAHNNFGVMLSSLGKSDAAVTAWRRAVQVRPEFTAAWTNLGAALQDDAKLDEAIACYRHAASLDPCSPARHNLLYALHFHPAYGPHEIAEEHRRWNDQCVKPLASQAPPHPIDPNPIRRLRIGYVSPDFRGHPVGRFMLPLLANHDHNAFEIFCYSDVVREGAMTAQLRQHADSWRSTVNMTDQALAQLVRQDRIDILVDLTMHMSGNRMLAFARRPAPIQITYLAYCSTTGSEAIDYRLTDPYLDPPGIDQSMYSEKSIHLPTYWCYPAPTDAPPVAPPPALTNGYITFGCLNNPSKISDIVIDCWAEILRRVPHSRLTIHMPSSRRRTEIDSRFERAAVHPDRIRFLGTLPTDQYFQSYNDIDIALDPFPYPGGTTTFDALWMGLPVITKTGSTAVSRSGAAILPHVSLQNLITHTTDHYITTAVTLSNDLPRLQTLRQSLRPTLASSALMNARKFTTSVETAFHSIWRLRNPK